MFNARFHRAPGLPPGWGRSAILGATAAGALLLGVLVYLADRSGSSAAMLPRIDALAGRHVFGAAGQWLPSFAHAFAFSLLTAAALPAGAAQGYAACVFWGAVNVLCEFGQHAAIREHLAAALQHHFGRAPPVQWAADYFLRGTFDVGDLIAACLGALGAAGMLHLVRTRRERTDAH